MTPPVADPVDEGARRRIETDLDMTLFVDAGAGSGKTSELVKRVLALVVDGGIPLESIAAITFTEKAATELRDRIRQALEQRVASDPDPIIGARCRAARDEVDAAAIGTLHAFARRILAQHAIEAGLPPRIEVLDEVTSAVAFEHRWRTLRDELLDDAEVAPALGLLLALGVKVDAIRHLSSIFDDNWDLVASQIPTQAPPLPSVAVMAGSALDAVSAVCQERASCKDGEDKLSRHLVDMEDWLRWMRSLDDVALVEALHLDHPRYPSFKVKNRGLKTGWPDVDAVRQQVADAGDQLDVVRQRIGEACVKRLAIALRAATLEAAEDRRRAGKLEFHDLLVMARALLRDPVHGADIRSALHRRYQRILLDEFQDTDPIQIELAVRIAAADPASDAAGVAPWTVVEVAPGHLFVVGDPKQSIYRFRRADISVFLEARDRLGPADGSVVELTTNFRTGEPIVTWVNDTFARLMSEGPDVDLPVQSQPDYLPLAASRPASPTGSAVSVVGRESHPAKTGAEVLRACEAADVAASIRQIVAEGWAVDDGDCGWRPARLGDITILVPTRASLPYLEDELEQSGIAFRAETSSLVYASRAIRDLLLVARAVDDPTDHLMIVSALRTPLLGCADDELYEFKVIQGGHWGYLGDQPSTVTPDSRVAAGLAYLRSLSERRYWQAPAELLDAVARDRRGMELGFVDRRSRDVWRRLRWVIDQARAWSDAIGGTLREYLAWVDQQNADGARVAEGILPETDDDAVRIMTIHAAKGLEFPVTIVSGMSTEPRGRYVPAEVVFPRDGNEVGYRFGAKVKTPAWEAWAPIDEQMALDERMRLLYVACTRARDHLVVSLHRKERSKKPERTQRTNAELLVDGMGAALEGIPDVGLSDFPLLVADVAISPSPIPLEDWQATRTTALSMASRPTAIAATALSEDGLPDGDDRSPSEEVDPGLQKRPRDLDLAPWLKGRYGTAVGRAVHGVLQVIDLATGEGLDDTVAAQCEAEAIPQRAGDVRRLVESALASPTVIEAAHSPHWREVYVAAPMPDGQLLEGYIDLLYWGPDGLMIVDYKTAATSDVAALDLRVEGYQPQGDAYRMAVEHAIGQDVGVVFLFLTPGGATALRAHASVV